MEVVYVFHDSDVTRIPVYDGDLRLSGRLGARGGGVWNNARKEFVFREKIDSGQFARDFSDLPFVWVEKNSPVPVRTFGFLGRPWKKPDGSGPREKKAASFIVSPEEVKAYFQKYAPPALPEKLSPLWINKLETELRARKYSLRTLRSYIYFNRLFCRTLQKTPEEIERDDVTRFLADLEKNREYSASSLNLAVSAIKFFYKYILKKDGISSSPRPKHDQALPAILDKTEVAGILAAEKNPKHRLLLTLVYSSGLRVSEVVSLRREHIDLSRGVIYIRRAKGRKDRCTLLSEKAAGFISEYLAFFNITDWLFPGSPPARPLSIRSAQYIFDKAVRNAGITKEVSIHSLRHAFATHLLESGTDIRYIQTLLGHNSIRTTERYTHVARREVLRIQSPLDSMPQAPEILPRMD